MAIELTILGYSSALPLPNRFSSAQWLQTAGRFFLIDCGEGTQILLRKYKLSFQKINHILISHLHSDHYLGLPGLISSMDLYGRTKALHIHCPEGLDEFIDLNLRISYSKVSFPIIYHFTTSSPDVIFENEKLRITSFPLKHRIPTTGFVFETKPGERNFRKDVLKKYFLSIDQIKAAKRGEDIIYENQVLSSSELTDEPKKTVKYSYCSDTMFWEKIIPFIENSDLIYHESTFLEQHSLRAKATMHSTALQAAKIALLSKSKQLILGHFSIRYKDLTEFESEAKTVFKNTTLASEGKVIKLE